MTSTPLDAPVNLRDVHGLRTADGRAVRAGVLYRSEMPRPTAAAPAEVPQWPPTTVIDLRLPFERTRRHPLDVPGTVVHTAVIGIPAVTPGMSQPTDPDLTWVYRHLLPSVGDEIARIVRIVADAPGPTLVHCTVGKDRTGIVVSLLLRAVGVQREEVLADYLRTGDDLDRLWAALNAAGVGSPLNPAMAGVDREALAVVLDEVEAGSGGTAGWLSAHGVTEADLSRLADRLLEPV